MRCQREHQPNLYHSIQSECQPCGRHRRPRPGRASQPGQIWRDYHGLRSRRMCGSRSCDCRHAHLDQRRYERHPDRQLIEQPDERTRHLPCLDERTGNSDSDDQLRWRFTDPDGIPDLQVKRNVCSQKSRCTLLGAKSRSDKPQVDICSKRSKPNIFAL